MKVEVLDAKGQLVDELPASRRRGLNRIVWSMQTKPPQVPPAASIAGASTQGQRVLPGTYTVRITKNGVAQTMPVEVVLDPRATYTLADRQVQYAAAERVKALFVRMSTLSARIAATKEGAEKLADDKAASAADRSLAEKVVTRADILRKQVVATTEGGAITGEERLRELTDTAYGAITSSEAAPTPYQMARVDALERELGDVERDFASLQGGELKVLNSALQRSGKQTINAAAVTFDVDQARGGPLDVLARGLLGMRFTGSVGALLGSNEKD